VRTKDKRNWGRKATSTIIMQPGWVTYVLAVSDPGVTEIQEICNSLLKERISDVITSSSHFTLRLLSERREDSLIAEGWMKKTPCHVTINTTITMPSITGCTYRRPNQPNVLQTASRESIPDLKETLVELTVGCSPLWICVFITKITHKLILVPNVLHTNDAFTDHRGHALRLQQEQVLLSCRHGQSHPAYADQQPGDTSTVQEVGDCKAKQPPEHSKWPDRT
jgi:hypothetical protein